MMKRLLCLLLAALLFAGLACAEEARPQYIRYGDSGPVVGQLQKLLGVEETKDGEPVFASLTLAALLDAKAKAQSQAENAPSDTRVAALTEAEIVAMPFADKEFDAAALYLLLLLPVPETDEALVWVPMHGGAKHHKKSTCSKMDQPRQMPASCAEALSFTPCKRCR